MMRLEIVLDKEAEAEEERDAEVAVIFEKKKQDHRRLLKGTSTVKFNLSMV